MARKPSRQSTRPFDPQDLLNFVELDAFTLHWSRLGGTDEDLVALQVLIMRNPTGAPVIRGTGGLRKMRFAAPAVSRGKSSGIRVCYVYFRKYGLALLATVYAKSEETDLTDAQKRAVAKKVAEIERYLKDRYGF